MRAFAASRDRPIRWASIHHTPSTLSRAKSASASAGFGSSRPIAYTFDNAGKGALHAEGGAAWLSSRTEAKVVIVGVGGIVGASVAHHLVERGWDDIVGIDKSGVPTDIGSTAHASDFCYTTSHDFLSTWTTLYSIDFFEKLGRYARIGGIEVARVGDDARMDEIRRKVASGKAFGTRARLIEPAEIKEKFPLIEEDKVQGGLWDPDAGLVVPRSQTVAGELVDRAEAARQAQDLRQHAGDGRS